VGSKLKIDDLIDRFVEKINRLPRRRIREDDLPADLREGPAEFGLYYHWRIQPFTNTHWISTVESLIPGPLPPSYRSLVTRYIFPAFEAGPLLLMANTGQDLYNEMSLMLVRNKALSFGLLENRLIQFARPVTGEYDPVCFDVNRPSPEGDYPIVRVNHEPLLTGNRPLIIDELAPSFRYFIERLLHREVGVVN
jgi:hypothetical protein